MSSIVHDLVIIGGGQAAVPLAKSLTEAGQRVALAERKDLGGSCVNFGCTPTKAALTSAKIAHQARRAQEYGIHVGEVRVDFAAVLERARRISQASRDELVKVATTIAGLDYLTGNARLTGRDGDVYTVMVGERTVRTKGVVLNTGTRSVVPEVEGLHEIDFITAENWLHQETLPQHLIMIGGSYIGLEMSQFYRRMGSEVTVVESEEYIASREDADVSEAMQKTLAGEGIKFMLRSKLKRVAKHGEELVVTLEGPDGTQELRGSHLFLATGRRPNTGDLGLDSVGVKTDDKGIVEVDETLATNVKGIWAAGDIRGGPMFTHTSWDDYRILESQMIGDKQRTTKRIVPYAMFIDPQLGRVGMTEKEAREQHTDVKVATFNMTDSGKANMISETQGMIKVVVDGSSDRILGAAVFAAEGAELVHVYVDLMNAGAPYMVVRDAIHIHPTLAEDLQSVMSNFKGEDEQ
jgi:pyruvate/2-oxoglutarate dehydrogenase complex dihydrolipoamide dehydrogenase (E3) component